jgi:hypothetical protein
MQYAYEMLYDNLIAKLGDASNDETCDMVQRIRQISEQIIDFYLANPRIVLLLAIIIWASILICRQKCRMFSVKISTACLPEICKPTISLMTKSLFLVPSAGLF